MRFGVIFLMAGVLALSACAKDDKDAGVDNGACTQATVDNYNNIIQYGSYSENGTKSIYPSCQTLQSLLNGRSCKAEKVISGQAFDISYSAVERICSSYTPGTPIPAPKQNPRATAASKYADANGLCNEKFKTDADQIAIQLNIAVRTKDGVAARKAQQMCRQMETDLPRGGCQTYDSKKQEYVKNSRTEGDLGLLCRGADKISLRFRRK